MNDDIIDQMFAAQRAPAGPFRWPTDEEETSRSPRKPGMFSSMLRGLAPGAGSGLPFTAPYIPGVSGMRMVGTGGMPGYGAMSSRQIFR